jgi:hypothetical protein
MTISLLLALIVALCAFAASASASAGKVPQEKTKGKVWRKPIDVFEAQLEQEDEEEQPKQPQQPQYFYGMEAAEHVMGKAGPREPPQNPHRRPNEYIPHPPMSPNPAWAPIKEGYTPVVNQNYYYYTGPDKHEEVDETMPDKAAVARGDAIALRHLQAGPARQLQSCGYSTANGWWTSNSPPTPSCSYPGCGYCYTTSRVSSYTSITSYLYCNVS